MQPSGAIRWIHDRGVLIRDEQGKPRRAHGIMEDITERERAKEMQAAMARERKMLAKQRATELAKANEALRECLDALACVPELDDFLGQVMAAITNQLGAVSSTLRLWSLDLSFYAGARFWSRGT